MFGSTHFTYKCLVTFISTRLPFEMHHPSTEPHSPLVILEKGRLSFSRYEQQICSRRDYIRYTRKHSEPERTVRYSYECFLNLIYMFILYLCLSNLHVIILLLGSWSTSVDDTTKTSSAALSSCSTSALTYCPSLWSCTKLPESCCS